MTMRPRCLLAAVVLALVAQAAAADCDEWWREGPSFFSSATLEQVIGCLDAGSSDEASSWNPEVWRRWGWDHLSPLHFAARDSVDPAVIAALLDAGFEVNVRGDGNTPLHLAAYNDSPAVISFLIEAGAEVDARDERGATPLHVGALVTDNPAVIEALVVAGADVNARSELGWTPLHRAANGLGSNPAAIIWVLLESGARVNARSWDGDTPLHLAARRQFRTDSAPAKATPAIIGALLAAGANAGSLNNFGRTPWDSARNNENLVDTDIWWRLREGALE